MHLFSQPGKLVGAYFYKMSYRSFHLYPSDLYTTGEKIGIVEVTKHSFHSVSFMFLLERASKQ